MNILSNDNSFNSSPILKLISLRLLSLSILRTDHELHTYAVDWGNIGASRYDKI